MVGDRLLVRPEEGEERTNAGLYLPPGGSPARQAKAGWVVSVGPGVPVFILPEYTDANWEEDGQPPRYVPMQAQEGDYVLFLQKVAVEITFEKKNYLIVPNSAVLVLMREDFDAETRDWSGNSN